MPKRKILFSLLLGLSVAAPAFPGGAKDDTHFSKLGYSRLASAKIDVKALRAAAASPDAKDFAAYVNTLVPVKDESLKDVEEAVDSFARVADEQVRAEGLELAGAARVALLIARASSDGKRVTR